MHGYELRKRVNAVLGMFRALSYGTLYPCLKSLLARGWIAEAGDGAGGAPAGAGAGPNRRGRRRWSGGPRSGAGSPPESRAPRELPQGPVNLRKAVDWFDGPALPQTG